jgi:hypothetical protein
MSVTGFEVGALFKIVDEATGPLRKILATVRELNEAIKVARDGMAGFSSAAAPGIAGAIADVNMLTAAWGRVEAATLAAARAAAAPARSATGSVPNFRPGVGQAAAAARLSGGGSYSPGLASMHVRGPGVGLPGGSHANFGGPAAVAAGIAGVSVYEAANMEDATWWLNYHARRKATKDNNAQFRKIIEDAMKDTGLPLHDVAEAATQEVRMFQATPGVDPISALPKLLRAAAFEAKAKPGTTMQEATKSIVGMAHMVGAYTDKEIDALLPKFAFLSIANPQSLNSLERSFSYSVPLLQSGMDVDPFGTMVLGTALSTAGVTNTKSGTWVREMVRRSMPTGKDEHDSALKRLGLLDDQGKPTWYVNGKPDPMRLLEIAGPKAADIPTTDRVGVEHEVFGTQGSGAFSVLSNPKVLARARELRKGMEGSQDQYDMALEQYRGTTKQEARSVVQRVNVELIELGRTLLPAANAALSLFSAGLRNVFTGGRGHHIVEDRLNSYQKPAPFSFLPKQGGGATALPSIIVPEGNRAQPMSFLQGPPQTQKPQQISLSLSVDGRTLAQTISEQLSDLLNFPTGAPSANHRAQWEDAHSQAVGI